MPAHQAPARRALCPIGVPVSRPRRVSMIGVKGWLWANQRTPAGMESVGTNALLTKGNTSIMRDRLFAPSGVLANSPKATASQVKARVSPANMPAAATHSTGVAVGLKARF